MIKTDVVIIDSGVSSNLKNSDIQGTSLFFSNGKMESNEDLTDNYGHGTAIYNIIRKYSPVSKIYNIKLFDNNECIDETNLIYALKYIQKNVSCKLINLSLGLKLCNKIEALKSVCSELVLSGIILVSAFDNDGCYSFPAAFDNVIGVDSNYECKNAFDFEIVEGNAINVRAKGGLQRVTWNDGKNIVLGGSSFACAYVSSYIANLLQGKSLTFDEIIENIKKNTKVTYHKNEYIKKCANNYFEINRAAISDRRQTQHRDF
ncbi:MAG: S8 family serine peptidase [Oscillospiraceae bacterium]|nr:S8 family serine peptidase [Oscillospiraceae bacterium]